MTEACRQAGVSATAVYRHFANKEAILAEVARQGFDQLTGDLRLVLDSIESDNYRRRLVETGLAYVAFASSHPAHFQVMFGAGLDKEGHPECQESGETALQILIDEVARAVAGGALPATKASTAITTLWATVHGLAMLDLDGIKSKKQEMLEFDIPACLEAVVHGICS